MEEGTVRRGADIFAPLASLYYDIPLIDSFATQSFDIVTLVTHFKELPSSTTIFYSLNII